MFSMSERRFLTGREPFYYVPQFQDFAINYSENLKNPSSSCHFLGIWGDVKCKACCDFVSFGKHVLNNDMNIREPSPYLSPHFSDAFNARFLFWTWIMVNKVRVN